MIVCVQIGQCGNEIGYHFFTALSCEISQPAQKCGISVSANQNFVCETQARFFRPSKIANDPSFHPRAVMVDMEKKVIDKLLDRGRTSGQSSDFQWRFHERNAFYQRNGSGNNWAMGYADWGPATVDEVVDLVRREIEACDSCEGLLLLLSLAGGTGSGAGAFYSEIFRTRFPTLAQLAIVVWPFSAGEVCVQNYNIVLSLSRLVQSADGILILENDHLQNICSTLCKIAEPALSDLNKLIAQKLASFLLPTTAAGSRKSLTLSEAMAHLVPLEICNLLSIRNTSIIPSSLVTFTTYDWSSSLRHILQMLVADAHMEHGINWEVRLDCPSTSPRVLNKSLANLMILRGKDADKVCSSSWHDRRLYAGCAKEDVFQAWYSTRIFKSYDKSCALLSNSQTFVKPIDRSVSQAWEMFHYKAFFHHYTQFGLEEEDFRQSFFCCEQVLDAYQKLS